MLSSSEGVISYKDKEQANAIAVDAMLSENGKVYVRVVNSPLVSAGEKNYPTDEDLKAQVQKLDVLNHAIGPVEDHDGAPIRKQFETFLSKSDEHKFLNLKTLSSIRSSLL